MSFSKLIRAAAAVTTAALLPAAGCEEDVGEGDQPGIYTVRVSVDSNGLEAAVASPSLQDGSQAPSVSWDGQYVAFDSDATNLVRGDGNGFKDIFVKNRATGEVELVSINSDFNTDADDHCTNASISADGRHVAFMSAGFLASGFTTGGQMVYVHDRDTSTTRRVIDPAINPAPGGPATQLLFPSISGDGRYVTYVSNATNLAPGLTLPGGFFNVYVSDMSVNPPAVTLVSRTQASATTGGNNFSFQPRFSLDGSSIVFASNASDLFAPDVGGFSDIFLGTPTGAACIRLSNTSGGAQGNGNSSDPFPSEDATVVAFQTSAPNLMGLVASGLVVRDGAGAITVISRDASGTLIGGPQAPKVSADGRFIAFAGNVPGQPTVPQQVYVKDMLGGIQIASVHLSGAFAEDPCAGTSLSHDGRWVAWHSGAANLVTNDTNGVDDIFVRGPLR